MTMMGGRRFLEDFIRIYESEPCLWQMKHKLYHDRNSKEAAYERLVRRLRDVEPDATKDTVLKKINNLRSAYRKEVKKVNNSLRSGAIGEDIYKPKLWYYPLMSFLLDQHSPRGYSRNTNSNDEDSEVEENDEEHLPFEFVEVKVPSIKTEEVSIAAASGTDSPDCSYRKRPHDEAEPWTEDEPRLPLIPPKKISDDRFDLIGRGVALKLRGLPTSQMLLAERLVNEVLFRAEMGWLNVATRVVGDDEGS